MTYYPYPKFGCKNQGPRFNFEIEGHDWILGEGGGGGGKIHFFLLILYNSKILCVCVCVCGGGGGLANALPPLLRGPWE